MPYIRETIHGIASMVMLTFTLDMTNMVWQYIGIFTCLSNMTAYALIDVAGLPASQDDSGVVIPAWILMSIWVF